MTRRFRSKLANFLWFVMSIAVIPVLLVIWIVLHFVIQVTRVIEFLEEG